MNLSQLYYFSKLAELQHYTQAAQELYITQPTLSGAISSLEQELGIELFQKRGRNVYLTKYGREFYHYVSSALQELDKGIEVAREHAGKMGGTVDIGCIHTIQGDYLAQVIHAFIKEKGHNVTFNIHLAQTNAIINAVEREQWDVGFCSFVERAPEQLFFVPILHQQVVAVVRKDHPLAGEKSLSFAQLEGCSLISYHTEQPVGQEIKTLLDRHKLSALQRFSSEEALCGQVALTDYVAICLRTPALNMFSDLAVLSLSEVPDDFHIVHMIFNRKMYKEHAVESFIDFVTAFWSYTPHASKPWRFD
ncbi:MAG: LysR family transcriptional regulator [Oscillospiraceae bacterium]|nr:LysR family transcriptional regulator [Oscillospiraceae bacterium]